MAAVLIIGLITSTEAAKIDSYRNAILNKSFTLKYKVVTPQIRRLNKEFKISKSEMFGTDNIFDLASNETTQHISGGIVVVNGDERYFEQNVAAYKNVKIFANESGELASGAAAKDIKEMSTCTLIKGDETFYFYWDINENGNKRYFSGYNKLGGHSTSIKANNDKDKSQNPYNRMIEEYNYGNPILAQVLMPILPLDKVVAMPNTPIYQFIKSGTLDNGLTFEDFAGSKNNTHYAVRYYFSGDKLVKIYAINYIKNSQGIQSYEKTMIDIVEFSMVPDENYLSLPKELRDKTKRDKGNKK